MTTLDIKPQVKKFIQTLPPKHQRQLKDYILSLQDQPKPHDARPLKSYAPYFRADSGEYRIIYRFDAKKDIMTVVLAGKRNDDAIYRLAKRALN